MSEHKRAFHAKTTRKALRHVILLSLIELPFREFARRLADSRLFQWFTSTEQVDGIRPVSKSTLERYEKMFSDEDVAKLVHELNCLAKNEETALTLFLQDEALDFNRVFADSTCIDANIHFPVDWVLLRDGVRTLINNVALIRKQGLLVRMSDPKDFKRRMNQLCIAMTHARYKKDSKRTRKRLLRKMKELSKTVSNHAKSHRDLLLANREKTDWSEAQAGQVLTRLQNILDQLPSAIHQAHERIIGERLIKNSEKILSFYEPNTHVVVRGKAGSNVEFGNGLYLAEQENGLIIDWKFIREQPPSDSKLVKESIAQTEKNYGKPQSFTADRGFHSKANTHLLDDLDIFNAICPRSVPELREKLKDDNFRQLQTRRASTEARVAILTNSYVGSPLRSRGFKNRNTRIGWSIFAHNLWKLAAMTAKRRQEISESLAA